jgi:hypothetical protein
MVSALLVQRNGMHEHVEQFLHMHVEKYGFSREQIKIYRYYYDNSNKNNPDGQILMNITDDIHSTHYLYVLDFKNEKDKFLYELKCGMDNIDLYFEYDEWNTSTIKRGWEEAREKLKLETELGIDADEDF